MQIISGIYKGHKIKVLGNFRPTMGHVREALFNVLLHNPSYCKHLRRGKVLDLFCGSGSLGLEALSHGAERVIMMDINVDNVRENSLSFMEKVTIIRADASNPPQAHQSCDLVFIDPPYQYDNYEQTLDNLITCNWVKHGSLVILEASESNLIHDFSQYKLIEKRKYGKTYVFILRVNMAFDIDKIRDLLLSEFADADISLEDIVGDSDHFSLVITSKKFANKTMIEQHKMVYKALEGKVGNEIHALKLKTVVKDD